MASSNETDNNYCHDFSSNPRDPCVSSCFELSSLASGALDLSLSNVTNCDSPVVDSCVAADCSSEHSHTSPCSFSDDSQSNSNIESLDSSMDNSSTLDYSTDPSPVKKKKKKYVLRINLNPHRKPPSKCNKNESEDQKQDKCKPHKDQPAAIIQADKKSRGRPRIKPPEVRKGKLPRGRPRLKPAAAEKICKRPRGRPSKSLQDILLSNLKEKFFNSDDNYSDHSNMKSNIVEDQSDVNIESSDSIVDG